MSWLFSQALVEAFSGASSSDGEPCAPLSVMPTQHKFWRLDKTIDPLNLSRFGLTCAVLTEDRGSELLGSFLAAFHAPTFPAPAAVLESTEKPADFGASLPGSLARFDLNSSSWRTPLCSLFEGLDEFSGTWPRWGSMRNGVCWERTMQELRTKENVSGFWPTPLAADGGKHSPAVRHKGGNHTLTSAVHSCPTPRASDATKGGPNQKGSKGDLMLPSWAAQNATYTAPCADDTGHRKGKYAQGGSPLSYQVGGQLNPPWVEWLMGWPIGWTALEPLETARFQKWPSSHSSPSTAA
jgi:hypothetical protein